MEIRVLRYFLAIAQEGSLTGACNLLHITQPTLSRQIKSLEEELGQKLFSRGSHSMTLTREGYVFRKRAEDIIAMVDQTTEEFRSMESDVSGDVYLGCGETQAIRSIAEVIKAVREDYPGIRFHLYSGNLVDVTERMDRGLLDFGVIVHPADLTKYEHIRMPAEVAWGVVMRKDAPLAGKKTISKSDLLNLPLICSRQIITHTIRRNVFLQWFGDDFEQLNIVATYNLIFNASILVEAGIGYAMALDKLVNTSENSPLCFRPLSPAVSSGLDIIWKKNKVFSSAAALFLEALSRYFASLSRESPEISQRV